MFIYEFKSKDALISKIVISNSYLTIYTNKPHSPELNPMIDHFKLRSIRFAEDPNHVFCHNPYIKFSAQGDAIPHKHLRFPPDIDRLAYLKEIFNYLIDRQADLGLKRQDQQSFIQALNEEREFRKHDHFPKDIQEVLDNYNASMPYIAENEVEIIIDLYSHYINDAYYSNVEAVNERAAKLFKDNGKIINKRILNFQSITLSEIEQQICSYYQALLDLREILLAIDNNSNNINLYHNTREIIEEVITNPNYKNDIPFSENIKYINSFVQSKINSLESSLLWRGGVIATIISTSYHLFSEDSVLKALCLGILSGALAPLALKYVARPLTNAIKHSFFSNKKNNFENKQNNAIITDPDILHGLHN